MGAFIDNEEQAVRLARAILSDVALYNEERIRTARSLPEDLAAEIAEGRSLFQSRVSAAHHSLFETQLAEFIRRLRPDLGSANVPVFGSSANVPVFGSSANVPVFGSSANVPVFGSSANAPTAGSAEAAYRRAAAREAEERAGASMPTTSGGTAVTLATVAVLVGAVALWFVVHR